MTDLSPLQDLREADADRRGDLEQLDHVQAAFADLVAADPFLADAQPRAELLLVEAMLKSQLAQRCAEPLVLGTPSVGHRRKKTTARPLDQFSLDSYRLRLSAFLTTGIAHSSPDLCAVRASQAQIEG